MREKTDERKWGGGEGEKGRRGEGGKGVSKGGREGEGGTKELLPTLG